MSAVQGGGERRYERISCLRGGRIIIHATKLKKRKEFLTMEQYYIIRCDRAGVFFANIKERNGSEAVLTNCRRLWYWNGACSLSQLAVDGTCTPKDCKFSVTVEEMTVLGVIEVIPCTEKATESIKAVKEWKR